MTRFRAPLALVSVLTAMLLLSCTTGSGGGFESVLESTGEEPRQEEGSQDRQGSESTGAIGEDQGNGVGNGGENGGGSTTAVGQGRTGTSSSSSETIGDSEEPALEVRSDPSGASVYINDSFSGTTPLTVNELDPGEYRVAVRAEGYYERVQWIRIGEQERVTLEVELRQITGRLSLSVTPGGAQISVDGTTRSDLEVELPVGRHTVRVRKFGYETETRQVTIRENRTTALSVELSRAPFRLEQLSPSRRVVNPENPGRLGEVAIGFRVSAPGRGTLRMLDESGRVVHERELGPFETWEQRVTWRPAGPGGENLPDGTYEIALTGSGMDSVEGSDSATAFVEVSRSARIRYRTLWSGLSGTLYAPTPEVLPEGSVQLSLHAAGHEGTVTADETLLRVPTQIGFRLPLSGSGEINASGTAYLYNDAARNRLQGTVGLKWQLFQTEKVVRTQGAVAARGTLHSATASGSLAAPDTLTDYAGLSLNAPALIGTNRLSLVFVPELHFGPAAVRYGNATPADAGWRFWGYGRSALLLDWGPMSGALSAAVRTVPFDEGLDIEKPFALGAEAHWLIPDTLVELSFIAAAEVFSPEDWYVMAGGGLGIIY